MSVLLAETSGEFLVSKLIFYLYKADDVLFLCLFYTVKRVRKRKMKHTKFTTVAPQITTASNELL